MAKKAENLPRPNTFQYFPILPHIINLSWTIHNPFMNHSCTFRAVLFAVSPWRSLGLHTLPAAPVLGRSPNPQQGMVLGLDRPGKWWKIPGKSSPKLGSNEFRKILDSRHIFSTFYHHLTLFQKSKFSSTKSFEGSSAKILAFCLPWGSRENGFTSLPESITTILVTDGI